MNKWLTTFALDFPQLRWLEKYLIGHKGFIAGGCFKQIFTGQKVKDIDIFFRTQREQRNAENFFDGETHLNRVYFNDNITAYEDTENGMTIELVKSIYGEPSEILSNFDFTLTKFALFVEDDTESFFSSRKNMEHMCLYHTRFFEHLMFKRCVVDDKLPFPVNTFERLLRYAKYGYFPCRATKKRIIQAINQLEILPDVSLSLYNGID